jgi:amino-acid N-acetyltransferase
MTSPVTLRAARERDVPTLLALINGYATRGLLLPRTEASLRQRLGDFTVAEQGGRLVGCGALSELGRGLGEVRSLAVAEDVAGLGLGHLLVGHLFDQAAARGFREVIALTRRQSFFARLGFAATERERFVDKLRVDCAACPRNVCCDEIAMVRAVRPLMEEGVMFG